MDMFIVEVVGVNEALESEQIGISWLSGGSEAGIELWPTASVG